MRSAVGIHVKMNQEFSWNPQMFKCPFCGCMFENHSDLKKHIESFGDEKQSHVRKWKKIHYEAELGEQN